MNFKCKWSANLVILICITLTNFLIAQKITEPYDFPVKPGTPEWKELKSGDEMAEVCQVPQGILDSMTVEALVLTCINYPLLGSIMASNNVHEGLDLLIPHSNCLQKLVTQKDADEILVEEYSKIKLREKSIDVPDYKDFNLEVLLTHPNILDNMNDVLLHKLKGFVYRNLIGKINRSDLYGRISVENNAYILMKLLNRQGHGPELVSLSKAQDIEIFEQNGQFCSEELLQAIINLGK